MADRLQRRDLFAAFGMGAGGQVRLLVPFERADDVVEGQQFADAAAQRGGRAFAALLRAARQREVRRLAGHQHRRHAAVLGDVDDLLLRNAAHDAEAVIGRRETHHRIEGLDRHAAVRTDHRELGDRQAGRLLQHPRAVWIVGRSERLVQHRLPRTPFHRSADGDALAAIGAVGLQDQRLAMAAGIVQQVAFRPVRQAGAPVGDDAGPQHMAAEQAALVGRKEALRERRIAEDLKTALVVEIAHGGGDHAILPEQQAHRLQRTAEFLLQRDDVARLVVAVGDVDDAVLVPDLAVADIEFGRIGVRDGEAERAFEAALEDELFVDPVLGVLAFDEGEAAFGPPEGARMVDEGLHEEIALVARQFDLQAGIVREEARHDVAHHQLLGERAVRDAADAREIRLHEFQRVLPARRAEIADRVEPTIDRIGALVRRRPGLAQPALLALADAQHAAHVRVGEIERGQALQRVHQLLADEMDIGDLSGHREQRTQHDRDRLHRAFALVEQLARPRILGEAGGDAAERGVADMSHRGADAPVERDPREAEGFDRAENGFHIRSGQGAARRVRRL